MGLYGGVASQLWRGVTNCSDAMDGLWLIGGYVVVTPYGGVDSEPTVNRGPIVW